MRVADPLGRREPPLMLHVITGGRTLRSATLLDSAVNDTTDHVRALPAAWTNRVTTDTRVVRAAGRAAFWVTDLLQLSHRIERID